MLLERGERVSTVAEERAHLEAVAARGNSAVLVAEQGDDVVGYVEATGGEFRRNRHSAYLVIGVRRSHAGRGIGGRLLRELERWAKPVGIRRLELTVMTNNDAAIGLYQKLGYELEGRRRGALLVNGEFVDEHWLAKVLPP
jgi:RimJ/RimL family protein N-acetyltransferase